MNNEDLKHQILSTLQLAASSPFLFVGSGFSRRYLGLPQWEELLKIFCDNEDEFDELMASASQKLPGVASLLSERYHDRWWKDEKFKVNRERLKKNLMEKSLRIKLLH